MNIGKWKLRGRGYLKEGTERRREKKRTRDQKEGKEKGKEGGVRGHRACVLEDRRVSPEVEVNNEMHPGRRLMILSCSGTKRRKEIENTKVPEEIN